MMIFVFGSNLSGIHGAGAARHAMDKHGAKWGIGVGMSGESYAIPSKDADINTMPIEAIRPYVEDFLAFAKANSQMNFLVTQIGCGLAGYTPHDIAPLFKGAPENCFFAPAWHAYIGVKE
jgi:hypothetical protein